MFKGYCFPREPLISSEAFFSEKKSNVNTFKDTEIKKPDEIGSRDNGSLTSTPGSLAGHGD